MAKSRRPYSRIDSASLLKNEQPGGFERKIGARIEQHVGGQQWASFWGTWQIVQGIAQSSSIYRQV